jgi:trk system potassium uptake protein
MRVVIVGAGDVGTHIAEDLADVHDIAVVDRDEEDIERLEADFGVTGVTGDGRSLDTLEEAGIRDAEVVIASTDDDAVNVMVCGTARNVTEAHTIARVKSPDLYETWQHFESGLGVDMMLSVDRLTAESLVRTVALPGALAANTFVDGQVEMAEFEVEEGAPIAGKTVEDADEYPSLTFAGVLRDDDIVIPSGETVIEAGDRVVVIGSPSSTKRFAHALTSSDSLETEDDIVIVGGGEVGTQVAEAFEREGYAPRLIEHDPDRVAALEERFERTTVVEGDVRSFSFLADSDMGDADLLVGTLDDETNYVLALLARDMGVEYTAAVVDEAEYGDLFEAAGVDVVVQPHTVVARQTTRVTRGYTDEAAVLEQDSAEVLEITVESGSALAGDSLSDVALDLPDGFVIGAVVRNGTLRTPRGGTVIQTGDHVVAFVDTDDLDEVAAAL